MNKIGIMFVMVGFLSAKAIQEPKWVIVDGSLKYDANSAMLHKSKAMLSAEYNDKPVMFVFSCSKNKYKARGYGKGYVTGGTPIAAMRNIACADWDAAEINKNIPDDEDD